MVSVKCGAWYKAEAKKPKGNERVLCVKELKSGRREMCFGYFDQYASEWDPEKRMFVVGSGKWVTGGGNNNVLYWMPLPKMPEEVTEK